MFKIRFALITLLVSVVLLLPGNSLYAQTCNIQGGFLSFSLGEATLSKSVKEQIGRIAGEMRAYPYCRVVVQGNGSSTKPAQQLSWLRATNVIDYLNDTENIILERFIILTGGRGNENGVDFRTAGEGEEGPSTLPPPFPHLQR